MRENYINFHSDNICIWISMSHFMNTCTNVFLIITIKKIHNNPNYVKKYKYIRSNLRSFELKQCPTSTVFFTHV